MIVRSIKVSSWRCLLDEVKVGPFEDGLNVIHAPNGTGKSLLFEALQRALLDGHRVTGKDVEALRPWGRALAPKVTVELVHGGQEYRITKQFLDNPSALIERKEDGRYRRLAEGGAADEQTRLILTKNPPGRGLARVENWGIAQILWAPQGNLAIGPLSGDVISDIRNMLSAQVSSTGTGPIEKRIEECYSQFFSAKGKLKGGKDAPRLTLLKEQLSKATEACQNARDHYLAFEETSRRVEEFAARRTQARYDADEITGKLRDVRVAAESYLKLVGERDQRLERVAASESQYKELKQGIELVRSTERELAEAQKKLTSLESDVPLKDREIREREKETSKQKAELEDARKGRIAVDAVAQLAEAAHRFYECNRALQRSEELISNIEKVEKALADYRQERNAHVAPDAHTLKAVRKAVKDRDDAQVRIEASLITLEIVPENDGSVEVVTGETPGAMPLKAGAPTQIQGSPEVAGEISHVARLRAWGPVGSIEEHRKARAEAEQKLKKLTQPFATSDQDALETLAEKAKELDTSVAESETKLETLLNGQTLDDLVQERAVLKTTHRRYLDTYHEWEKTPPDVAVLDAQSQEVKDGFVERIERCEDAWEKAHSALSAVAGQRETLFQRIEDTKRQVGLLTMKLTDLTTNGKPLRERELELQRVTMAWDAAKSRLEEIQNQLDQYDEDPGVLVEQLNAQLEAATQESSHAREQEVREEARLEGLCAQGTYSALALSEERVTQLEEDTRREELRVEAIRILHDTVAGCRTEAISAVSKQVEAVATRTLHRIAGRRLGRVQVGEAFEPAAVVPESIVQTVPLDNLSGGEQEQLYLATRLALAEVLGKEERQLVLLDDVLTATDSGRLARVMNILEETAQRLQVLVLTCHPERYRVLKNTRFFDLEVLVREATV